VHQTGAAKHLPDGMTARRDRDAGQQCVGFRTQCRLCRLMQGLHEYCISVCTASHPVVRSAGRQMCDTTVSGANGLSNHTANPVPRSRTAIRTFQRANYFAIERTSRPPPALLDLQHQFKTCSSARRASHLKSTPAVTRLHIRSS
jgi:hypothetical protein